jgi:hypothetical protein
MAYTFNPFTGKLDYYQPAPAGGSGGTPWYVPAGTTHIVAENMQEVVAVPQRNDGVTRIDGVRIFL